MRKDPICVPLTRSKTTGNFQIIIGKSRSYVTFKKRHGRLFRPSKIITNYPLLCMQEIIISLTRPSENGQGTSPRISRSSLECQIYFLLILRSTVSSKSLESMFPVMLSRSSILTMIMVTPSGMMKYAIKWTISRISRHSGHCIEVPRIHMIIPLYLSICSLMRNFNLGGSYNLLQWGTQQDPGMRTLNWGGQH